MQCKIYMKEVNLNSVSSGPQNPNFVGDFRSLLNTNRGENSEITIATTWMEDKRGGY